LDRLDYIAKQQGRLTVSGAPQGYDAYVAAEAARRRGAPVLFVAQDDVQADAAERTIGFFAPSVTVMSFPALRPRLAQAGYRKPPSCDPGGAGPRWRQALRYRHHH